eukprot:403360237
MQTKSKQKEGITWKDLTEFFMKSLLEARNVTESKKSSKQSKKYKSSKNAIDKVSNNRDQNIKDMINKLNLINSFHREGIFKSKNLSFLCLFNNSAFYCESLNKLLSLDYQTDEIVSYETNLSSQKTLIRVKPENHQLDAMILDFAYSYKNERLGIVMRDNTLCFYDREDNFKYEKIIVSNLQYFQFKIWWIESGDLWLTSDKTNSLYSWSIRNESNQQLSKVHDAKILDIISISSIKAFLNLFTANYTNEITVWNFESYSEFSEQEFLNGHDASITAMALIEQNNLLISADQNFFIKLWRNQKVTNLIVLSPNTFITQSNRYYLFDISSINFNQMTVTERRVQDPKSNMGQNLPIIDIQYAKFSDQLIIPVKEEIRILDFSTGLQTKIYSNISKTSSDISCCEIDHLEKHLYTGDSQGQVRVISLSNDQMQIDLLDRQGVACQKIMIDYKHKLLISIFEDWSIYVQRKDFYKKVIRVVYQQLNALNLQLTQKSKLLMNLRQQFQVTINILTNKQDLFLEHQMTTYIDGKNLFNTEKPLQQNERLIISYEKLKTAGYIDRLKSFDINYFLSSHNDIKNENILQCVKFLALDMNQFCIAVGTMKGVLYLYELDGQLIANLKLNQPLPLKWDIAYSSFDFRIQQVYKSYQALSKLSEKYGITTQADFLSERDFYQFMHSKNSNQKSNEKVGNLYFDEQVLDNQNDINQSETQKQMLKQKTLTLQKAASQYFKLKNLEESQKLSLKKIDYDNHIKNQNQNHYEEIAKLRQLGLIHPQNRESMMWDIEKEKRDYFSKKAFQQYVQKRSNLDFKEIDFMIHQSQGGVVAKEPPKNLSKMYPNQKDANQLKTFQEEIDEGIEQLENKLKQDHSISSLKR